jgi:hypothetical protein
MAMIQTASSSAIPSRQQSPKPPPERIWTVREPRYEDRGEYRSNTSQREHRPGSDSATIVIDNGKPILPFQQVKVGLM